MSATAAGISSSARLTKVIASPLVKSARTYIHTAAVATSSSATCQRLRALVARAPIAAVRKPKPMVKVMWPRTKEIAVLSSVSAMSAAAAWSVECAMPHRPMPSRAVAPNSEKTPMPIWVTAGK